MRTERKTHKIMIGAVAVILAAGLVVLAACSEQQIEVELDGTDVALSDVFETNAVLKYQNGTTTNINVETLAKSVSYGAYTEIELKFKNTKLADKYVNGLVFKMQSQRLATMHFELRLKDIKIEKEQTEVTDPDTGEVKTETTEIQVEYTTVADSGTQTFSAGEAIGIACDTITHSMLAKSFSIVCLDNEAGTSNISWAILQLQATVKERKA